MIRTIYGSQGSRINLDGKSVINLASNNYLGLANHPQIVSATIEALKEYGVGPGAGRTIAGNFVTHNTLENKLAQYKGVEDTLVYNSGLSANLGLIPYIMSKEDVIFSDALNHASIIDGCRLSGAKIIVYKHKDMSDLNDLLKQCNGIKNKLIVTDGVFSMDGDLAPLPEIVTLARQYQAKVMVDDAHGDGVMGKTGRGTTEYFGLNGIIDYETGSLSKAFGTAGGFVAGKKELIENLRHYSRMFVFTSSPLPPAFAAATCKALDIICEDSHLLDRLWQNREYFYKRVIGMGYNTGSSKTPILPLLIGNEETTAQLCEMLFDKGVFAQALQYPVVAKGGARLRIILSAEHTREDLDISLNALEESGKVLGLF